MDMPKFTVAEVNTFKVVSVAFKFADPGFQESFSPLIEPNRNASRTKYPGMIQAKSRKKFEFSCEFIRCHAPAQGSNTVESFALKFQWVTGFGQFFRAIIGGEGGIRTPGTVLPVRLFSKQLVSAYSPTSPN